MYRTYLDGGDVGMEGGGAATGNLTSDLCTATGLPTTCSTSLRYSGCLDGLKYSRISLVIH